MPAVKINPFIVGALLWLLLAVSMIVHAAGARDGLSLSTDDAMRLAETRDLLAGQSWFDTTQWRMNTPMGLPMHWSHLVDAGIGGLILLFRLFVAPATAETWALYVWPVLMLLPALLALAQIAERLAGRLGGCVALMLVLGCVVAMEPFEPGSIDHDNVQLALTLGLLAFLVDFDRLRWAPVGAALMACLSLAVGMQTLPYILVALAAVVFLWIQRGSAIAASVQRFGLTFALANVVLLAGATASQYRFAATCDTFSGFYAAIGLAGGLGLTALAASTPATAKYRIACAAGLTTALVALAAVTGRPCLHGPYAQLDPRLMSVWFSRIEEVEPAYVFYRHNLAAFLPTYCYAILATIASAVAVFLVERQNRPAALMAAAFAAAGVAVTTWEVRGLSFAILYALPGLAAFIVMIYSRLRLPKALAAATFFIALFASTDMAFAIVGNTIKANFQRGPDYFQQREQWLDACFAPADFNQMASLPAGRVLALVDQGPFILVYTKDSAVGGPYHRNASGILDNYAAFTGTTAQAAAIVKRRGIDYISLCKPAPDYVFYRKQGGANSLIAQLGDNRNIAWLARVPSKGTAGQVEIYRVLRANLP